MEWALIIVLITSGSLGTGYATKTEIGSFSTREDCLVEAQAVPKVTQDLSGKITAKVHAICVEK